MTKDICASLVPSHNKSHSFNTNSMQFKSKIAIDIHVHNRDGINFTASALIDTGSQYNLCPASLITKSLLTPVDHTIFGISRKGIKAAGFFRCRIDFGTGFMPNTSFLVIDTDVPVLLGLEFLTCGTVESFSIKENVLELNRKFKHRSVQQSVPLCMIAQPDKPQNQSPIRPTKNTSLAEKLSWLQSQLNLALPEAHECKSELNGISDLLIEYSDVFTNCPGTFP